MVEDHSYVVSLGAGVLIRWVARLGRPLGCRTSSECNSRRISLGTRFGDRISRPPSYNFPVTRERWAQIGITTQFLIIVRTLGEVFRLKHVHGTNFTAAVAMPYVGGALIAACFCWAGVALYFFRRYALSSWIALATVLILLVYKIAVIGW